MQLTFLSACLASVALSMQLKNGLNIPEDSQNIALSQTKATSNLSTSICQRTFERNKAELPDFYSLYASSSAYEDPDFSHTGGKIFAWADASETDTLTDASLKWKRAKDAFADHTLFGTNGVTPQDLRQGAIGNCWFISAASALSEHPGRVEKMFLNTVNEISSAGIYAVNFYTLGVPHTVIVDDWLPLYENWDGSYSGIYAKPSADKAIYGPILEKAFAKYHGNFKHIVGGDPKHAIKTLYGAPFTDVTHSDMTVDALWEYLKGGDERHDVM